MHLAQALKEIIDNFGINSIEKPGIVKMLEANNGFEEIKPAKMLIKLMVSDGHCSTLREAYGNAEGVNKSIGIIKARILEDYGVAPDLVDSVLQAFAMAFGVEPDTNDVEVDVEYDYGNGLHIHTDMHATICKLGKYVLCGSDLPGILEDFSRDYRENANFAIILKDILALNYGQKVYDLYGKPYFREGVQQVLGHYIKATKLRSKKRDVDYMFFCLGYALNPKAMVDSDDESGTDDAPDASATVPKEPSADGSRLCRLGMELLKRKDLGGAFRAFRDAAALGCVDAFLPLGKAYDFGEGTAVDTNQAYNWYRRAYDTLHSSTAAYYIGQIFQFNRKDPVQAYKWYTIARDGGDKDALYRIGYLMEVGQGVRKDIKEALCLYHECYNSIKLPTAALRIGLINHYDLSNYAEAKKWYEVARRFDLKDAVFNLGALYEDGKGVTKDLKKAIELYTEGYNKYNDKRCANRLGAIYDFDYNKYNEAFKWYNIAKDLGNDNALFPLGYLYEYGRGTKLDLKKAMELYRESYDKTNSERAANRMGQICYYDFKDYREALDWFEIARERGVTMSLYETGRIYEFGLGGVPKDIDRALMMYRESYDKTSRKESALRLGLVYHYDKKDYKKAIHWYNIAIEAGCDDGLFELGYLYEYGNGVAIDLDKALSYYQKSYGKKTDARSAFRIGLIYHYDYKMYATAAAWYEKALKLGHEKAQAELDKVRKLM